MEMAHLKYVQDHTPQSRFHPFLSCFFRISYALVLSLLCPSEGMAYNSYCLQTIYMVV